LTSEPLIDSSTASCFESATSISGVMPAAPLGADWGEDGATDHRGDPQIDSGLCLPRKAGEVAVVLKMLAAKREQGSRFRWAQLRVRLPLRIAAGTLTA
jgi:hypothetical protein